MNNVKKNRTGLKLLGSVRGGNYRRFTMNKTQQNQPVYKNIEPRCPGSKGKRGCTDCSGSNTNVGCKTCWGCTYTFDVSSGAFGGAYPSYGSFANVNPIVDSSSNPPCEWRFNAIVEGFSLNSVDPNYNARVQISIEDNKCINVNSITGVYFYAPVGGNNGTYVGQFNDCSVSPQPVQTPYDISGLRQSKFVTTAKRMGAPYRNPIAGWRRTLDCCEDPCTVILFEGGNHQAPPSGTLIGYQYKSSISNCTGTVTDYTTTGSNLNTGVVTSITVQLDDCCCIPTISEMNQVRNNEYGPITNIDYSWGETSGAARQPTNTVYKDNYSGKKNNLGGCCATDCSNNIVHRPGIEGRTHRPIIRSGMQPKSSCCKPNGTQCFNDYSYSYRQYQNNKRCMSYDRSLEKYVVPGSLGCGIYKNGKNSYRKSSCCDCYCNNDMPHGPKCSNKAETHTVYKPSNKKFSTQGAVSSGSRLDRLKLDAIRASNSKCIKGKRCNPIKSKFTDVCDYKVPNGKYGAGKPRFTGWMFNGHHSEVKGRVYNMVRYNQQPLGIPQLTVHPPGKTCIKQCFPRTLDLGSNRSTAAGNRARIPGSKCVNSSNCNCAGCNNDPNYTNQGVPCC